MARVNVILCLMILYARLIEFDDTEVAAAENTFIFTLNNIKLSSLGQNKHLML